MMNKYECLFIIDLNLWRKTYKVLSKIQNLLETSAQLENIDEWGKRKLAYEVADRNEGYYVLADFSAESDFPREFERILKITDGILKYLIIKK